MNVYSYDEYRDFLINRLDERRGLRKELAEHLGCQNGYVSQVLQRLSDFSLEQGMKVCSFLQIPEE